MPLKVLIASSNTALVAKILETLGRDLPGVTVDVASLPTAARKRLTRKKYDVVVVEMANAEERSPWIDLARYAYREVGPVIGIVVVAPAADLPALCRLRRLGVGRLVPWAEPNVVAEAAERIAAEIVDLQVELQSWPEIEAMAAKAGMPCRSRAMREVMRWAWKVAPDAGRHHLISGPTGVGKTLLAEAILEHMPKRPVVRIHCGELSQHERLEYYGGSPARVLLAAIAREAGSVEGVDGGCIFFDEISIMSYAVQAVVAKMIEHGYYVCPDTGARKPIMIQVLATTNADIDNLIREKRFRHDLGMILDRTLAIPPLDERPEDVVPLAEAIIARSERPSLKLDKNVADVLTATSWKNNYWGLARIIESAIESARRDEITIFDIQRELVARAYRWESHDPKNSALTTANKNNKISALINKAL